jgi:hypothetical protein
MRLIPIVSHGPCDLTVAAAGHQQSMKYGFLGGQSRPAAAISSGSAYPGERERICQPFKEIGRAEMNDRNLDRSNGNLKSLFRLAG